MTFLTRRECLVATTALTVGFVGPLHAQTQNTTPLGRLLLGWGTEKVALDTPQATTVIDQTEIEQSQATTVGELFDQTAGVQAVGSERPLGQTFNIRGFGEVPAGDEGRIILQQDGATKYYEQYRIGAFFADPSSFCNIEVLRGPSSATLYGGGALGGVIRFETCEASDYLEDDQNNYLRLQLGAETNGVGGRSTIRYATRATEKLELLTTLTLRQADDYVDGSGNEIAGSGFTAASGLISGRYALSDTRSVKLSYEIWDSDLDDTSYEQTGSGIFGTIDRHTTDQTLTVGLETEEAIGAVEATFTYSDTDVVQDDASRQGAFGGSLLFEDTTYGYQTVSLDTRVTSETGFNSFINTLIYGVTVSHQVREADSATVNQIDFHPEGTSTRYSVFAQNEVAFDNGLTLVPGLRLDYAINSPDSANTAASGDVNVRSISPKLAASYDITESFGIFGSIAQTQRAPTLDELFSFDAADARSPLGEEAATDLDPETARSIEFGITSALTGVIADEDALDTRVTTFFTQADDLIARDSTDGTPYNRNIDEAEIWGLELETAYDAGGIFARASLTDIRGKETSSGDPWPTAQARNASFTLGGRNATRSLEYGWNVRAFDEIEYSSTDKYDGYAVHNLFLDFRPQRGALDGVEVQFGVDNVFDNLYQNSLDDDNGRGRTFRLTAAQAFGW